MRRPLDVSAIDWASRSKTWTNRASLVTRVAHRPALSRGSSVTSLTNTTKPPEAKADNEIEVFSAPGEGRECVEIVRRVIGLAHDGVPFDRIAVLLRSPEEYRAHLKEAFGPSRHSGPFRSRRRAA